MTLLTNSTTAAAMSFQLYIAQRVWTDRCAPVITSVGTSTIVLLWNFSIHIVANGQPQQFSILPSPNDDTTNTLPLYLHD
jgi:hypothetical protein